MRKCPVTSTEQFSTTSNKDIFGCKLFTPVAVFCDCAAEFQVDAKPLGTPLDKDLLKTDVTAPSGKKVKPVMKDNKDNTFDVNYTPIEKGKLSYKFVQKCLKMWVFCTYM